MSILSIFLYFCHQYLKLEIHQNEIEDSRIPKKKY